MAMALKIMRESKASGVPITLPDAQIMAEAERYKEASIPFTKEFATMYDAAYNRQQRAWEASIGKMAGTSGGKDDEKPLSLSDPFSEKEISTATGQVADAAKAYKEDNKTDMGQDQLNEELSNRLRANRMAVVSAQRYLQGMQQYQESLTKPDMGAYSVPATATPGMTPTPRATPGPASPGGEDERRARAKARNDELKAMNISAEVRRTILLQEGLIDQ